VLEARAWKIKPPGLREVRTGGYRLSLFSKVVRKALLVSIGDNGVIILRVTAEQMVKTK
jgi:hypothetical protein